MQCLQPCEPPLAARYADEAPHPHVGPSGGFDMSISHIGDAVRMIMNMKNALRIKNESFRCMFRYLRKTRRTGIPSVFSRENFGCPGMRFYGGFIPSLPSFNHHFTTTGIPGIYPGERLMPSVASAKRSSQKLEGRKARARYLIFEPFTAVNDTTTVESVIFFANTEVIAALCGLVRFAADDDEAVRSIYGSGCASIFAWPAQLHQDGITAAVLGIFDPAARPWLRPGEMTLAMSYPLFRKITGTFRDTFIYKPVKFGKKRLPELMFGWKTGKRRAEQLDRYIRDGRSADRKQGGTTA